MEISKSLFNGDNPAAGEPKLHFITPSLLTTPKSLYRGWSPQIPLVEETDAINDLLVKIVETLDLTTN